MFTPVQLFFKLYELLTYSYNKSVSNSPWRVAKHVGQEGTSLFTTHMFYLKVDYKYWIQEIK